MNCTLTILIVALIVALATVVFQTNPVELTQIVFNLE